MIRYTKKDHFIRILKTFPHAFSFQFVSPVLKEDREFVLEMLKINGLVLEYVSPEFQADRELVLEAVKQNVSALEYASPKLKADREFILEVVETEKAKIYFKLLEYVSPELNEEFLKLIKEKNLK